MNIPELVELGLTEAQAKAYSALVELNPVTPPVLATHIKETRTNCYKILEQLEELNLAERDETEKKKSDTGPNPLLLYQTLQNLNLKKYSKNKNIYSIPCLHY